MPGILSPHRLGTFLFGQFAGLPAVSSSPGPPDLPADLLAAVKAAFLATEVAADVAGGIFHKLAGRRGTLPYVVFEEVSSTLAFSSSTGEVHRTRLRFKLYSDDGDEASALGDRLEDAFWDQRLLFAGGGTGPWTTGDRGHRDEPAALSASGRGGWYFLVEFNFMTRRGG